MLQPINTPISQIDIESIKKAYIAHGSSPFQSPLAILARLHALSPSHFACFQISLGKDLAITAFEKLSDGIWRCFFLKSSFLTTKPLCRTVFLDCLVAIRKALGAEGLYFPHVDHRSTLFSLFKGWDQCLSIRRLPCPFIDWGDEKENFIDRIRANSKRSAQRRWQKFERLLRTRILHGDQAVQALSEIEKKSWKHRYHQSMHFREAQLSFYSQWLKLGGIHMHIAEDQNNFVAYRLDARDKKTVYTLKYSYDENYHHCSPGYYLLTKGVYARWQGLEITTIDLWGSPDILKNGIKTGEYQRSDFFWPKSTQGKELFSERLKHDQGLFEALGHHVGLKKIYSS